MEYVAYSVWAVLLCLGVTVVVLSIRAERKRAESMRQAADEMGFEYAPTAPADGLPGQYPGFHLFSRSRSARVRNLIRGKAGGLEVAVFDYAYTTGTGKSRHTWRQTVLAFEIADADLPGFSLRPESVFHWIGQWVGYQDIDFESHPNFSRRYLLRSGEEDAVRALFNDTVLEYYEAHPNVCTEGCGNRLVYYRSEKRIDPAAIRGFLEEGFAVLALFRPP